MKTVVIRVDRGVVHEVYTDSDETIKVLVLDADTDGMEDDELIEVEGEDVYVYRGLTEADQDPERTLDALKRAGRI